MSSLVIPPVSSGKGKALAKNNIALLYTQDDQGQVNGGRARAQRSCMRCTRNLAQLLFKCVHMLTKRSDIVALKGLVHVFDFLSAHVRWREENTIRLHRLTVSFPE